MELTGKIKLILAAVIFFSYLLVLGSGRVFPGQNQQVEPAHVAGSFYPADPGELSGMIDKMFEAAPVKTTGGEIFALISPHAGYAYSGPTAAIGYKLIRNKPYQTVVVIATSHQFGFSGVSVYPGGTFRTPLGGLTIDEEFTAKLLNQDPGIIFEPRAFQQEHSVEVQLPFLQKALVDFKIVPIVMGQCSYAICSKLADLLAEAVGQRKDVLIVASTDMYHGYDYQETEAIDTVTLDVFRKMDGKALYKGLEDNTMQLCGGAGVVTTLLAARILGHNVLDVLGYTTSAEVTGQKAKGVWTVGYASCAIDNPDDPAKPGETAMLNNTQRKRLLEIARSSISTYLTTGKKLEVEESDPLLSKEMGAFVTLTEHGRLRGCIGNLQASQPLYLTIRDMAVEAAVSDPRFKPVELPELNTLEIDISALSPLERVDSADKIKMGLHGVLVRRGGRSGVYLPQVATETNWTKEEFLSSLCKDKAGLAADAWKDKDTQLYIFIAEVFSEKVSR